MKIAEIVVDGKKIHLVQLCPTTRASYMLQSGSAWCFVLHPDGEIRRFHSPELFWK